MIFCIRHNCSISIVESRANTFNCLQVSWIRKARHPVVLSSGTAVFTSDRRVKIRTRPDTWILEIDPVLQKDDGLYECQVNTRDTMSLVFKLNVERK
jgi:hypothetical protein